MTSTSTHNNKIALVTGGSRGIGAAIAQQLAAEGAKVALTYSSSPDKAKEVADAITKKGGTAIIIKADSSHPSEVKAAVAETVKQLGGLDILVNNAGIFVPGAIEDMPIEEFDRTVNINVKGLFVAIQEAVKHMKKGGRIINIGSCVSAHMPFPGLAVYTMSKAAVEGLTRGLARELGQKGITINNVQPGPIDTDMNPADSDGAEAMKQTVALGRYGTTQEIASLVNYLASSQAGYITGANYLADGGFAA